MQVIKKQMADGVSKRRVGFVSKGAPARQHSEIQTPDGETVGIYDRSFDSSGQCIAWDNKYTAGYPAASHKQKTGQ